MTVLLVDNKTILKRYLEPMQCSEHNRNNLVKILFWPSDARKKDTDYTAGKKTITHEGKQYEVDGEVKVKL